MVTQPQEKTALPSEDRPELPSPAASDDAAPEATAPLVEDREGTEVPAPTAEERLAELKEIAKTPEFQERLKALPGILGEDVIRDAFRDHFTPDIQSGIDRGLQATQHEKEIDQLDQAVAQELASIRGNIPNWVSEDKFDASKAEKGLSDYGQAAANFTSERRELEIRHALAAHEVHQHLTEDDRRKLALAKNEGDWLVRARNQMQVYLDRALELGLSRQSETAQSKNDANDKLAEKLGPLAELLFGGATKRSVTSGATPSGGTDSERVALVASGKGTEEDVRWFNEKYRGQRRAPRGA